MCPRSFPQRSLLGPPNFGFGWAEGVPSTFAPNRPGTMERISSTGLASKPIILEPQFGICFPGVFWDVGRRSVSRWKDGIEDVLAKGLRSWQARARASVLTAIVASTTMRVVAAASLLPLIAVGTPTGIQGVARVTVEDETLMHRGCGVWPATSLRLVD